MEPKTRIWVSPEQSEILNTSVDDCYHGRGRLALLTSNDNKQGVLFCGGCGTLFNFLGHVSIEITSEDEEEEYG